MTGSAESDRGRFNPIYDNPGDPFGWPFNLPFAWYLGFYSGIRQDDTIWIAALLAFGYFFCASAPDWLKMEIPRAFKVRQQMLAEVVAGANHPQAYRR